jgi:Myb/SANT-like DNA-binding domain
MRRDRSESPIPNKKARRPRSSSSTSSCSSEGGADTGRVYSLRELEKLVSEYHRNFTELEDSSQTNLAVRRRSKIWTEIGANVSKVHGKHRKGTSCQDKIKKLKSALKLEGEL